MDIGQLILNRDANSIVTCDARMTMRDAIAILADKRIGALPVMEDRRVVGIFSERDVIYCMAKEGGGCLDRPLTGEDVARSVALVGMYRARLVEGQRECTISHSPFSSIAKKTCLQYL